METLVLVFDAPAPALDTLAGELSGVGATQTEAAQIVVESDDARAYLRVLDGAADEVFADWPTALIPATPTMFALDYNRALLAAKVVCTLAAGRDFLLDTNFGVVLRSAEFCRKAADDSWTWERWS